ncbi:DUF6160 family protein [Duganella callida]|uniref:DUF6160 domain-containing protein n=1 Tax=Duganella callida TaxID=2561932 RepID=A0A4Y9SWJ8_9BURK|nr:DUF6160 family protein [Duganella callida]TFW29013.1 hypothetical protein E4L98_04500 [Duganella callida]
MMRGALAVLAWACAAQVVSAMEPMNDAALSSVRGRDGVSFDLNGFAMSGDARVSYTTPSGSSLYVEKFAASRSDNPLPFSDPFRLDVVPGAPGLANVIDIAFPANLNGDQRWQMAYDWGVGADGVVREQGSVAVKDLVFYGGGLQFTTPQVNDGIAFGAALKLDIGQLSFQPRGRDDATEAMILSGIHIGGAGGGTWAIANVASQPAVINALTDELGPRLHIGIDWPDARYGSGQAPAGSIAVDNISFVSPGQPAVDLGSSRIGSVQIQYLDIKFKY